MKKIIVFLFVCFFYTCQDTKKIPLKEVQSNDIYLVLKNGILLYKNEPFTGLYKEFDSVNQTYNLSTYVLGKKEGLEKKNYTNNLLAEERFYKKGLKTGIHKGFWQDGSVKFEYHFNEEGVYHGSFKEWSPNGQIIKEFNYDNGKEKGTQRMWNTNGTIRANYIVKYGERFGLIGLKKCYTIDIKNEKI